MFRRFLVPDAFSPCHNDEDDEKGMATNGSPNSPPARDTSAHQMHDECDQAPKNDTGDDDHDEGFAATPVI